MASIGSSELARRRFADRYAPLPRSGLGPRHAYLIDLIHELRPTRILELGVSAGAGASLLIQEAARLNAQIQYWGVDLFLESAAPAATPHADRLEICPMAEVRARLLGLGQSVTLLRGPTSRVLREVALPPMDLIYIDAGHSYAEVRADWEQCRPLLAPGGVVVLDDYTDRATVVVEGYGVSTLVDELRAEEWPVAITASDTVRHGALRSLHSLAVVRQRDRGGA